MLQGQGVVVTECKGATVVANKLQAGVRRPRGRRSRIEHRMQAATGDIRVQWMPSHQTVQQAAVAGLLGTYVLGIAEADLLVGRAVQDVPGLLPLLTLFRKAAVAAQAFWSLFRPHVRVGWYQRDRKHFLPHFPEETSRAASSCDRV
eukprot:5185570-Amphidinium_carterae.4